jgi:NAD(P)-dependent dehydrogenase (short-subunit alcohol dehydrogenase family)
MECMSTPDSRVGDPVALVTGGSAGLGRALSHALAGRGWQVVTDARDPERLRAATAGTAIRGIPGDVTRAAHREDLAAAVRELDRLDLLVHNASSLGPSPLVPLAELGTDRLREIWETNVMAPLALTSALIPELQASSGAVLSVSSDAAVEHYEGWGGYGATKAALDHLTLTLAAETGLTAWAVDPGDMRTAMHQAAYPGEDITDRPLPEDVVPHLLALLERRPPSGRYRAAEFAVEGAAR